jgi:hypothetical protein
MVRISVTARLVFMNSVAAYYPAALAQRYTACRDAACDMSVARLHGVANARGLGLAANSRARW